MCLLLRLRFRYGSTFPANLWRSAACYLGKCMRQHASVDHWTLRLKARPKASVRSPLNYHPVWGFSFCSETFKKARMIPPVHHKRGHTPKEHFRLEHQTAFGLFRRAAKSERVFTQLLAPNTLFFFLWNQNCTEQMKNSQPYQHLRAQKSYKMENSQTTKESLKTWCGLASCGEKAPSHSRCRTDKVSLLDHVVYPDVDFGDKFEREPDIAKFNMVGCQGKFFQIWESRMGSSRRPWFQDFGQAVRRAKPEYLKFD